jgi:O-antigen/teichoic acid export membrane protein
VSAASPEPAIQPAAIPPPLRQRALRGALWTGVGVGGSTVLRLGSNLILARLLFPAAFGLMELANVLMRGLNMLSDLGVGPAVISVQRDDEAFLNTAWTVQVVRGWVICLLACALAWPFARFYGEGALLWLIPVIAISPVLSGLDAIGLHTEARRLYLGRITMLALGEMAVSVAVMVSFALVSPTVWALVAGGVSARLTHALGSHLLLPGPRPRLTWDQESISLLVRFGKWILLSTSILFLSAWFDRLLLGKLVSLSVLGLYALAYRLRSIIDMAFVSLSQRVLFPVLAELHREQPARLAGRLLELRSTALAVGASGALGMLFLGPWFFELLYDERYAESGWMSQLLVVPMWFGVLQITSDRALLAMGNTRPLALGNAVRFAATASGCLLGYAYYDLAGFLVGLGFGALMSHLVIVDALRRTRVWIGGQDLRFTALLVGASSLGLGSQAALSGAASGRFVALGLQLVVLGGVLAWAGRKLLVLVRQRRAAQDPAQDPQQLEGLAEEDQGSEGQGAPALDATSSAEGDPYQLEGVDEPSQGPPGAVHEGGGEDPGEEGGPAHS